MTSFDPKGLARVVSHLAIVPYDALDIKFDSLECQHFLGTTFASESPDFTRSV
jgi:hypothetical protein